jgi:hypothetical protein
MAETFAQIFSVGGKSNSLGRTDEVIAVVLQDPRLTEELYACLFNSDPWVRMRAADALEKVCRHHPDWLSPFIPRIQQELAQQTQPSIQWHIAQIYAQVQLSGAQKRVAIDWLKSLLSTTNIDWIVAANAMETLMQFTKEGAFPLRDMTALIAIQQKHASKSVVRRATKLLATLT